MPRRGNESLQAVFVTEKLSASSPSLNSKPTSKCGFGLWQADTHAHLEGCAFKIFFDSKSTLNRMNLHSVFSWQTSITATFLNVHQFAQIENRVK